MVTHSDSAIMEIRLSGLIWILATLFVICDQSRGSPADEVDSHKVTHVTATESPENLPQFVVSQNGSACVLASLTVDVGISYLSTGTNNKTHIHVTSIQMPSDATISGRCASSSSKGAEMVFSWNQTQFQLTINFVTTVRSWTVDKLTFSFTPTDSVFLSPASLDKVTLTNGNISLFNTSLGQSYLCETGVQVTLGDPASAPHVNVTMTGIQLQPFNVTEGSFNKGNVCARDMQVAKQQRESVLVPLVVAGCLAAIIIIVVVAYVASKNFKKMTYRSME